MEFLDYLILRFLALFLPYFQIYVGYIYFKALFRRYKTSKMGFQLTISAFLKFVPFSVLNEITNN